MKHIITKLFTRVAIISVVLSFVLSLDAFAAPVTLVSGSGTSGYVVPDGWTTSGTVEGGSYLKFNNGTITSPEFAAHTGLSFAYTVATFDSGTNHPLTIRILNASTDAVIVEKTTATPTSSSYISTDSPLSLGDVTVPFKIQLYAPSGKGVRLRNYSITGTPYAGGNLEDSDLAITGAPVTLNFDLYNNSTAQTVTYTTSSTGAVTVSGAASYVTTSVNSGTKTITVTPTAVTPSAQTITVNQAADATYASGSATFTVNVTDSTPFAGGDVTFVAGTDLGSTSANNSADEISKAVVTISSTDAAFATAEYRIYSGAETTISTSEGTITSIVFTQASSTYPLSRLSTSVGSYSDGTWTGNAASVVFSASGQARASQIVVTVDINGTPAVVCVAPTFSPAAGAYASSQNVTITSATDGATIYYTTDGTDPTTGSSVYSSAIAVSSTTTIKAFAAKTDCENSSIASATYAILAHAGTEQDPYTVSDAYAAIDAGVGMTGVYATGIVSQIVTALNSGAISYNISADGTVGGDQLQAYKGKNTGGTNFTSDSDIMVGDEVVVYGNLTKYGETYEFASYNQLVSRNRPVVAVPTITLNSYTVNAPSSETAGSLTVTYNNVETSAGVEIRWFEFDGTTPASAPSWADVDVNGSYNLDYLIAANDGAARTAYFKVYGVDGEVNDVFSELVTISQALFVPDYATLPFAFDGVRSDIQNTNGLTHSGLGTDYGTSPKLKFDTANDYLVLKVNERIGKLTFDIKGNTFSGGTFKIQTSADGTSYTDLKSYTELTTDTQSESFNNLDSDVRFVKWIYSTKSSGNVALGNIEVSPCTPTVTVNTATVNSDASGSTGVISVSYDFFVLADADINFYEADGTTPATYSWLSASINGENNVAYQIDPYHGGVARTAYFKVYALDGEANGYSSDLITVNQAAYVSSFASLNFAFDGGRSDIASVAGLTHSGLDTDYNSSPKLKFKDTNSCLILAIDSEPATLTYDIKGNSFSDGTFKVQTSTDGEIYTDLKSYSALGETQSESINLDANVRYIKWIYANKVNGNVALGNITVTKAANPTTLTLNASKNEGKYWVSFYDNTTRYNLPEGAEAFTMNSSHQLYRLGDDGKVIPKNTAVIIISTTATVTLTKDADTTVSINGGGNILRGSNSAVSVSGLANTPYVLGIKGGKVGFYEYTGTDIPANKAYFEE